LGDKWRRDPAVVVGDGKKVSRAEGPKTRELRAEASRETAGRKSPDGGPMGERRQNPDCK
jgi:hypothetical protein